MKDIVKTMLEHPIATIIVVAAIGKTATKIIKLVDKVKENKISVTVNAKQKEEKEN